MWASGLEQDTLVFPTFGVTGSRPQFQKHKKLSEGNITGVQTHTQKRILTLLGNCILGCSGIEELGPSCNKRGN